MRFRGWSWLLVLMVGMCLPSCLPTTDSGERDGAGDPDRTADGRVEEGAGDRVPDGESGAGPKLLLAVFAPTACGCPKPAPEKPTQCGWISGATSKVDVEVSLQVDAKTAADPKTEKIDLVYMDPDTGKETVLDSASGVSAASLKFDVGKIPEGAERFGAAAAGAKLVVRAVSSSLDDQGEKLRAETERTLEVDLVAPEVEVVVPQSGTLVKPAVAKVPYSLHVTDSVSGFGAVAFFVGDYELKPASHDEQTEGDTTSVTGVLEAEALGVFHGEMTVEARDCVRNPSETSVPVAVVSQPKFLSPPTVSCDEVKDDLNTGSMKRLRSGKGDKDDASADLLLAAGDGVYAAWGKGAGEFLPLSRIAAVKEAQDARLADFTGDAVPDLVVAHREEGGNSFVVSLYAQTTGTSGQGKRAFALVESKDAGGVPFALETADIDGDGFVDVVLANTNEEETVALYRHTGKVAAGPEPGTGYLEAPEFFTGVGKVSDIRLGDLDANGSIDIAMTRGKEGILSTYLNTGEGSFFMAHDTLLLGQEVPLLGLGDFNGDAKADALVFVRDFGAVYELNGLGDGYFTAVDNSQLGWSEDPAAAVVSILSWDATVPFVPKAGKVVVVGDKSNSLVVADFNVDGAPDAALAEAKAGTIQLFWGMGDGTLAESYFLNAWPEPYSLLADDLNQDPVPDMACLRKDSCEIVLLLSRGDGGCGQPGNGVTLGCPLEGGGAAHTGVPLWSATAEIPAPVHPLWTEKGRLEPTRVAAGDFDADGRSDMVVITSPPMDQFSGCDPVPVPNPRDLPCMVDPHGVIGYMGIGLPDLSVDMHKSMTAPDFHFGIADVAVGNFNDDQYPDIAFASLKENGAEQCPGSQVPNFDVLLGGHALVQLALNVGLSCPCVATPGAEPAAGAFLPTGGASVPSYPSAIAAVSLDGKGPDDLVVAIPGKAYGDECEVPDEVRIFENHTYPSCDPFSGLPQPPFQTCDDWEYSAACPARHAICEDSGSVKYPKTGRNPVALALGDVNNDGVADIVVANRDSHDVTLVTGTLGASGNYLVTSDEHPVHLISLGEEPVDVALGDVDGDGWEDLVGAFNGKISISFGMDGTNFLTPLYLSETTDGVQFQPFRLLVSDFSGDGFDDVLVLSKKTSRLYLYVSLGKRTFAGPYSFTAATEPTDMQMADINQDGCMDMIVSNAVSRTVSLLINEFCPK